MQGRTSHRKYHFILAKLLGFQRTFPEKSFVSGFGADSPNIQCTKKARHCRAFIFHQQLELRSKLCFKGLFEKSPLKIRQNFPQTYHFTLAKLLGFQRTFREKSFVSGSHSGQPQLIIHNNKLQYKYNDCTNIYK